MMNCETNRTNELCPFLRRVVWLEDGSVEDVNLLRERKAGRYGPREGRGTGLRADVAGTCGLGYGLVLPVGVVGPRHIRSL